MLNPMSLKNHAVVVPGATQGSGRDVAKKAAALGATLVLVETNDGGECETAESIDGDLIVIAGSATEAGFVQDTVHAVDETPMTGVIRGPKPIEGTMASIPIARIAQRDDTQRPCCFLLPDTVIYTLTANVLISMAPRESACAVPILPDCNDPTAQVASQGGSNE